VGMKVQAGMSEPGCCRPGRIGFAVCTWKARQEWDRNGGRNVRTEGEVVEAQMNGCGVAVAGVWWAVGWHGRCV